MRKQNRVLDLVARRPQNVAMLDSVYPYLLTAHNWLRWLAVFAALIATLFAFASWSGTGSGNPARFRYSIIFVALIDLQLLIGLVLYLGASPITRQAFQNFSGAMKVHELRFFAVEHSVAMLLAVALAHIGGALMRKSKLVPAKARGAAICFLLSLVLMLAGTPWFRPLLRIG